MPSSQRTPIFKFLIDENVRQSLYKHLVQNGTVVKIATKGASDQALLKISKQEDRILVTNDEDFYEASEDEVFAIVWLRISQSDKQALLKSFDKLITSIKKPKKKLFILYEGKWEEFPRIKKIKI